MRWALLVFGLSVGCFRPEGDRSQGAGTGVADSFQDDDLPMGGCGQTDGCASSGEAPLASVDEPCDLGGQCQSGSCAAAVAGLDIGPLTCQTACIAEMDAEAWCSDAASCCDGMLCTSRGFCAPAEPATGN